MSKDKNQDLLFQEHIAKMRITSSFRPRFNLVLYGPQGCGKTFTLAMLLKIPELLPALWISTELGVLSIKEYLTESNDDEIMFYNCVNEEEVRAVLMSKDGKYESIFIDTVTQIQEEEVNILSDKEAERNPKRDKSDVWLGDYKHVSRTLIKLFRAIRKKGNTNILLTCQEKRIENTVSKPDGTTNTTLIEIRPNVISSLSEHLLATSEHVWRIYTDDAGDHVLQFTKMNKAFAKTRGKYFHEYFKNKALKNPELDKVYRKFIELEYPEILETGE